MIINLKNISVKDYINYIQDLTFDQQNINVVVVTPAGTGWVKKTDLPFLMSLLSSKKSVPCIMHVVSSLLPSEHSTLGGHAARLIDSYKLHTPFPAQLTECPATDSSEITIIQKWRGSQNH